MSEDLESSGYAASDWKPLLQVPARDLFRKNAFRITGLPVDATPRDLGKHVEKLKVLAELGQNPQATAAFPLKPAPTLDDIRDAIQRLKDPEKRLIDEFLWFWPQNFGDSRSDTAIQALQKGDLQTAADTWMALRNHPIDGVVATHNLALIFHIEALNWENYSRRHEVDPKRRAEVTEYWKAAFYRWNKILSNNQFWDKVLGRVRHLNEPTLTSGTVKRMRTAIPAALIKINAELAILFAGTGKPELARLHIDLMDGIKEAAVQVPRITEVVLAAAKNKIQDQVRTAIETGTKNQSDAITTARELLDHTRDTFSLFDLFVSKNTQLRNDVFDEVAEACNRLQVMYHKATSDNGPCLELLKMVLPFAASQELREQIEKNIATLKENIDGITRDKKFYGNLKPISSAPSLFTFNGIGLTLYGSSDVDKANASYLTTYYFCFFFIPIFPICRYRVIREGNAYRFLGKAPLRAGDKLHLTIAIAIVLLFMISVMSASNTSQSSNTQSSTSYGGRSTVYQPTSSGYRVPSSTSRTLASEKVQIDSERASVQSLESQVDNLARQIERDRLLLDRSNEFEVEAFNAKVGRYNALLQQAQNAEAAFNSRIEDYNAKVRAYSR